MNNISRRSFIIISTLSVPLYFTACEKEITGQFQEIHWDRDMCDRCKMVISERNHAAQVVNMGNGRVYKFDDIGCVPLWFKEENISWKNKANIWITDVDSGEWIDAKTAFYDDMSITPMAYGFAAHKTKEAIKPELEIYTYRDMEKSVLARGR